MNRTPLESTPDAPRALAVARARLEDAQHHLTEAQAEAQRLSLQARDVGYLQEQGLTSPSDSTTAKAAAKDALYTLLMAQHQVRSAQDAYTPLANAMEWARRRTWVLQHNPPLAAAVCEMEAAEAKAQAAVERALAGIPPLPGDAPSTYREDLRFAGIRHALEEAMRAAPAATPEGY